MDVGSYDIFAYEASRPDATDTGSGTIETRACSDGGKLPWTNLTWVEARDACIAAGGRLCTETEWQAACEDPGDDDCSWSFSADCGDYDSNDTTVCNGLDCDNECGNGIQPTGQTGEAGGNACYTDWESDGEVHDLSGNVKEFVAKRSGGVIPRSPGRR